MVATNAAYILILFFTSGEIQIVQNLNKQSCYFARDAIRAAHQEPAFAPPTNKVTYALCVNTQDPIGTP